MIVVQNASSKPISEGALLTRSLEQLLRALIRLLVGKLSLVRLEELIRKIYVQESERRLRLDFPSKRVTLSQLTLLTGVDTRALTKLTNSRTYAQPTHEDESFLKEITPDARILTLWISDPRFCDPLSGEPRVLALEDGDPSFAQLVSCLSTARGLTPRSILNRLEMAGSIKIDWKQEQVRLLSSNFYPFISNDESAMLEVGFSTATFLLRTVGTNLENAKSGRGKLFQRNSFTHNLSPLLRAESRERLAKVLSEADDKCREVMAELEDPNPQPGQITSGVSMFYFESESAD